jgi:two-component system, chemotaxis family, CheB/CheR fusion protein
VEQEIEHDPAEVRRLLEFIHRSRGFDFSGYKSASLQRRLSKRMREVQIDTPLDYQDYLETHPDEFAALFDTILINVTSFFRDRPAWTFLAEEVIPQLLRGGSDAIRVWCAGCATGEEAYTIAILLAEALGEEQFRERVKIYATDVDENALDHARHATYSKQVVKGVPQEYLERYFVAGPQDYSFQPDLRRAVIFGRNDLTQDAPISRVDLLLCRNTLMYFTPETQSHVLQRFNFALSERGFLFLGRSEMLTTHGGLFTPYNLRWRVFQKVPRVQTRERLAFGGGGVNPTLLGEPGRYLELRGGAFALGPNGQIMVSRDGFVVDVNQRARELFGCTLADIGRPFQDLAISYRPVDLRSAIERAYETGEPITLGRVPWSIEGRSDGGGEERVLEIEVRSVPGPDGVPLGASISFMDITALSRLADEHDERKRELEKAHEELQSTVEELETTNEELQSTNEELETTNEELQSTNEELETTNEELRSTNEELETLNRQQLERTNELDRVNLFLEGILTNLGVGVVVLDTANNVEVWNGDSAELWGLRAEEVEGKPFAGLDIGLPVKEVEGALELAMSTEARASSLELDAVNRRGRRFRCRVRVLPLTTPGGEVAGVLLLMADGTNPEVATLVPGG